MSISSGLLTNFFSSSFSKLIILVKLGDIGYSSLADINTLMVARHTTLCFVKFSNPIAAMYLSNIAAATNRDSGL